MQNRAHIHTSFSARNYLIYLFSENLFHIFRDTCSVHVALIAFTELFLLTYITILASCSTRNRENAIYRTLPCSAVGWSEEQWKSRHTYLKQHKTHSVNCISPVTRICIANIS